MILVEMLKCLKRWYQSMTASNESDNTPQSSDATGHKWNFHMRSLDAARHVLAHIIESIFSNKSLTQDQRIAMIQHLQGLDHHEMAKAVDSHFAGANRENVVS